MVRCGLPAQQGLSGDGVTPSLGGVAVSPGSWWEQPAPTKAPSQKVSGSMMEAGVESAFTVGGAEKGNALRGRLSPGAEGTCNWKMEAAGFNAGARTARAAASWHGMHTVAGVESGNAARRCCGLLSERSPNGMASMPTVRRLPRTFCAMDSFTAETIQLAAPNNADPQPISDCLRKRLVDPDVQHGGLAARSVAVRGQQGLDLGMKSVELGSGKPRAGHKRRNFIFRDQAISLRSRD